MQHKHSILAFLAASSTTTAAINLAPRKVNSMSTITSIITTTKTTQLPKTIDTDFETTGVMTLIPNALTVTINSLPAYIYMETVTMGTTVLTITETHKVAVAASTSSTTSSTKSTTTSSSSSAKTSSLTSAKSTTSSSSSSVKTSSMTSSSSGVKSTSSSSVKPTSTNQKMSTSSSTTTKTTTSKSSSSKTSSSSKAATTSAIPKTQSSYQNTNVPSADIRCDGKVDGDTCGSARQCYQGGCYWYQADDMCGNFHTSCNTEANFHCANSACVNIETDPQNCGQPYLSCGGRESTQFGCVSGQCVDLYNDSANCGKVGNVCAKGTGCKDSKCIDTTSDNNNCSDVGYVCPAGTQCKDSWCQ